MLTVLILLLFLSFILTFGLEGLWSSLLMLFNIIFAGLIAMTLFEPGCAMATDYVGIGGAFFWDFFFLMGIFSVWIFILRTITDYIAPKKIAFPKLVDQIGGAAVAAVAAYVYAGFLLTAIQTAPIEERMLYGSFDVREPHVFGIVAPDAHWRGLVQIVSGGSFAPLTAEAEGRAHIFDSDGKFVENYRVRRWYYGSPGAVENGITGIIN